MDLGQTIAVYLGVFLLLWYGFATFYNRRRGIQTYRWLESGVKALGTISQAKWLGSSGSGARIAVEKAGPPFRRFEVAFLLETRELLPLWLINLLRGRRDTLILRAQLRSSPRGEVEAIPPGDRRQRGIPAQDADKGWSMADAMLPGGYRAAQRGAPTPHIDRIAPFLMQYGHYIRRLSISPKLPHLILEVWLSGLMAAPAETFFKDLVEAFQPSGDSGAGSPAAQ